MQCAYAFTSLRALSISLPNNCVPHKLVSYSQTFPFFLIMVLLQTSPNNGDEQDLISLSNGDTTETPRFSEDLDSTCSTPYVSAPSSPGRGPPTGYFFSAPASPMHFVLSSAPSSTYPPSESSFLSDTSSFDYEFEFSSRFSSNGSVAVGLVRSADELFLNGKIRPMKLSSHLQRPQILAPLIDLDIEEEECNEDSLKRGRDLKLRSRSLHRKTRSLSPLRNPEFLQDFESKQNEETVLSSETTTPSGSASSSRSSSSGRNSKKWIFLKDLLYRSKSEGRGNGKEKFSWSTISFSPAKDKKLASLSKEEKPPPSSSADNTRATESQKEKQKQKQKRSKQVASKKGRPANGVAKRRVPPSPHELHYTANRAQAEEMKKRTFLPYRQGLFGCLGFSSKGYGALNGLARSLNPVSSR